MNNYVVTVIKLMAGVRKVPSEIITYSPIPEGLLITFLICHNTIKSAWLITSYIEGERLDPGRKTSVSTPGRDSSI